MQNHEGYCLTVCDGAPKSDDFGILAHMDVVATGDDWSFPPFSGEIRDGYILGLGRNGQ